MASVRIGFDEVSVGDRLRVTYVEGSSKSGWLGSGIRRSVAAQVAAGALGKVWLSAEGFVVAHRSWPQIEIYKLS